MKLKPITFFLILPLLMGVCAGCGNSDQRKDATSDLTSLPTSKDEDTSSSEERKTWPSPSSSSSQNTSRSGEKASSSSSSSSTRSSSSSSTRSSSSSRESSSSQTTTTPPSVATIVLNYTQMDLYPTESMQLNATVYPKNAVASLDYYSSNASIATVSDDGLIVAATAGTVVITAIAENGVSASCSLTVRDPMDGATMKNMLVGDKTTFAKVGRSDAEQIELATEDPSLISIASDGTATANAVGKTSVFYKNKITGLLSGSKTDVYVTEMHAYSFYTLFGEKWSYTYNSSGYNYHGTTWITDINPTFWVNQSDNQIYCSISFTCRGTYDSQSIAKAVWFDITVSLLGEDIGDWPKEKVYEEVVPSNPKVMVISLGSYSLSDMLQNSLSFKECFTGLTGGRHISMLFSAHMRQ